MYRVGGCQIVRARGQASIGSKGNTEQPSKMDQPMQYSGFLSQWILLAGSGLIMLLPVRGQPVANEFNNYLLAPVRVHLLSAKDSPAIQTTLTEKDIARILGKINGVWAQAGLHFYLESLVREEANHQKSNEGETPVLTGGTPAPLLGLLEQRPDASKAAGMFHIYYVKEMPNNGIYFSEAIFVKDTAALRAVAGGIDEPLPRVTSHELGHALSLPHRQDTTNLMASGTTGTRLNEAEINQVRKTARTLDGIEPASDLMNRADALFRANKRKEAAELYSRVATIPVKADQVELAKKRISQKPRS
ncbi:MAG: hypothetical protein QOJ40_486 [Verrucomicrobiota bacterium]